MSDPSKPAKKKVSARQATAGSAKPLAVTAPTLAPLGMDTDALLSDIQRHLAYTLGRDRHTAATRYRYTATVLAVRDRMMERWKATHAAYYQADCRRGYYLSLEYLMGRTLGNALLNVELEQQTSEALRQLGLTMEDVVEEEADAGLGNGGLGRLAACFVDSCATLQLPVTGYGIRYDYGMFIQKIKDGFQVEEPDHWLAYSMPWELERREYIQRVKFGGESEFYEDEQGDVRVRWVDTKDVLAIPHDVPIPGYRNGTVNTLRLWRATATEEFDLAEFNAGDYTAAVRAKSAAENISQVLYPNDKSENGKELRLRQQYFLASASLQDILRRWIKEHGADFTTFADKNVMQLNDTHPTVAVPELMRLLMDDYRLGWDDAWAITTKCLAYTNHTLLPEALEKWSVPLFKSLLPRVLDIIFEINARFMRQVAYRWPGDGARQARMSIIEEGPVPHVRMAYLAIVGTFSVNGVAELHSRLLQEDLFKDFHALWPQKFNNKTNGVTQRRWLGLCNPRLSAAITETIGAGWATDLSQLKKLLPHAKDAAFRKRWREIKRANKAELAAVIKHDCGVDFPLDALFDVQVKRIHEYKRQLLNALHVIHLYDRIKRGDTKNWTKRAVLFGGKAAPGYAIAKLIIKFINNIAAVVNTDPDVGDLLKVAFVPNYRVSLMEKICPATELSEQISTAGKEASGTGNMKFMINGALTIGTLDGANIEIREEVGDEHFFLFGNTTEQIEKLRPRYKPQTVIDGDAALKRVIQLIKSGHFNQVEPGIFDDILGTLTSWGDYWMVCADFADYVKAQERAAQLYQDQERWTTSSIINTATSGKFSADRTIEEYNRGIWKLDRVVALPVS
ncbi:MAG: glycogen/starch/alpha-glucan phosphorylase [Planctomycetes bacterium]|nr:glycogen/starch/alpha-glucan phosphorylase [Planctomycetota bacterium]